jgi:hypothetical protein
VKIDNILFEHLVAAIKKMCVYGVISTTDYWTFKKFKKRKFHRPSYSRKVFKYHQFTDSESILWFRFSRLEIKNLIKCLNIPAVCKLPDRTKFTGNSLFYKWNQNSLIEYKYLLLGVEGLCILLRRLCYPNRLSDLVPMFHRDPGTISRIFNWMVNLIYNSHSKVVQTLKQPYITPEKLQEFSEVQNSNLYA